MARWSDLDPLAPTDMAAYLDLQRLFPSLAYGGATPLTGDRLELTITAELTPELWTVSLSIYDPWRHPDTFNWSHVHVDSDLPFDTGLLRDTVLPGLDYRICRITA
jgi:hypothetical protein